MQPANLQPSTSFPTDTVDTLLADLLNRAELAGVYLIARFQHGRGRSLLVVNGKLEEVGTSHAMGLGLSVFTADGHTAFASVDGWERERALAALDSAITSARVAARHGFQTSHAVLAAPRLSERAITRPPHPYEVLSLTELEGCLLDLNATVRGWEPAGRLSVRTSWSQSESAWRIVRSDGTDVSWFRPRAVLGQGVTAKGDGKATTVGSSLSSPSAELLLDPALLDRSLLRARIAADRALALLTAPHFPIGNYDLLIDYAMAKGLAHEAFGHAAEVDGLRASILADAQGRFRRGERLASELVTIVDEPFQWDHAWQPFSANGLRRERVTILKRGVLDEALADVFGAEDAGVRPTGAGRVESYRHVPVPRMTNIRIELPEYVPIAKPFEAVTPEDVRTLLRDQGWLEDGRMVLYLSGYKGGQVNPALGDFVFNGTCMYAISAREIGFYQPAIFSGHTLEALNRIRQAFGPLQLDALGTCGKAGQQVPSSGGSHYFLLLERPHTGTAPAPSPTEGVRG